MRETKRLWTDQDIIGMNKTISILRRMRSAAVTIRPTNYSRAKRYVLGFFGAQDAFHSQQEALSHAEDLADAAGDYFAAKLSKTNRKSKEFEKWQDFLSDESRQYSVYGSTTYARTSNLEVVGTSLMGRMRNLSIDPDYMLDWDLIRNNNLGASSVDCLIQQDDIGVISPLSGDYLMARVYSSYLQRTRGKSFPVKAAALSKDLSFVTLPTGPLPFTDKSKIGIYIDTTQTGNTARALYSALNEAYEDKTVYKPKLERTEFVQSREMEKFWKRYA